ncbi:hypothetical protein [Budvicia aquatica]|uniref:Uncharacterized protein n=1 Tax=Budvicia aquatica TaxID=82979 RepID=A0A2C6DR64_9GAMM|nr:hypothetical protein [Budvicia aquatica]PHI31193.1 hypothetical protein CRN84_18540 [Budvicia aquatica]VFS51456.1 Uncharacterised protein [Budvicia aquatica]
MNLLNQLTIKTSALSDEELMSVSVTQYEATEALLGGLSAMGSLMFHAGNDPLYAEAKDDMKKIGYSLSVTAEILQALNLNSANAEYALRKPAGANHE